MNTIEKSEKDVWKGFLPLAIAIFVTCFGAGVFIPVPVQMVSVFNRPYADTTWTALFYPMGAAACAPILGKLSDIFGRRKTLLFGMAVFSLGYIIGGIAPSFWMIVFSRFIVGLGVAAITPIALAYISTEFPDDKKGKGFAAYMLSASIAVVIGPTVGGLLMKNFGWRAPMFCAAIAGIICLGLCFIMADRTPHQRQGTASFDYAGAVLVFALFSSVLLIPSMGQSEGWTSIITLALIIIAIGATLLLRVVEKKSESPILSLELISKKNFILPVIILLLTQGLLQANMTLVILFVKMVQPDNMLVASYAVSILYLGMSIGSIAIGPQADKYEPKKVAAMALVITVISTAMMYLFNENSTFLVYAASLGLLGLGLGGNATVFMKIALDGLSPAAAGAGSGTYGVFRDVVAPFGVAVYIPLFSLTAASNAGKLVAEGIGAEAAAISGAISSVRLITSIELVCIVIGIILCFSLPNIMDKPAKAK